MRVGFGVFLKGQESREACAIVGMGTVAGSGRQILIFANPKGVFYREKDLASFSN